MLFISKTVIALAPKNAQTSSFATCDLQRNGHLKPYHIILYTHV